MRKCDLDLAPEAPWRCPDDCPSYERRMADVNWAHGTLVTPATPDEPLDALDRGDDSVARLLDEAEEIVNTAGPTVLAEVHAERDRGAPAGAAGSPQVTCGTRPRRGVRRALGGVP